MVRLLVKHETWFNVISNFLQWIAKSQGTENVKHYPAFPETQVKQKCALLYNKKMSLYYIQHACALLSAPALDLIWLKFKTKLAAMLKNHCALQNWWIYITSFAIFSLVTYISGENRINSSAKNHSKYVIITEIHKTTRRAFQWNAVVHKNLMLSGQILYIRSIGY